MEDLHVTGDDNRFGDDLDVREERDFSGGGDDRPQMDVGDDRDFRGRLEMTETAGMIYM